MERDLAAEHAPQLVVVWWGGVGWGGVGTKCPLLPKLPAQGSNGIYSQYLAIDIKGIYSNFLLGGTGLGVVGTQYIP